MRTMRANVFSSRIAVAVLAAVGLAAAAAPAAADTDSGSYGYVRVVEGSATLMQAGSNTRSEAEINGPLLAGDRFIVTARSRMEIVLADGNIVRLDGGSEVLLEKLAASPDANDRATVLRLFEGNLQLIVNSDSLGDELPRVETPNATVYIQNFGTYRITADRGDWSEVLVRKGSAEVVTDRGSVVVHADEQALVEGDRGADTQVRSAGAFDALERWGRDLNDEYRAADTRYIENDNLRYQSASLQRYGSWVHIDSRPYWRPRVAAGWSPYSQGRWRYTPSGLTWVSYEPWGWVPYHYGSWDYVPAYGWVWQPGYVYSPAWVYWYWGPSYTGWCPVGYYTRYYGSRFGYGFRYGVYGWAGGSWDHWRHWNFVGHEHFGRRDQNRYAVPVNDLRNRGGLRELPRGIITTDTKTLSPEKWKNPDEVMRSLRQRPGAVASKGGDLPDVTPFIAREPKLSADVTRRVAAEGKEARLDGTPLRPATLGRKPARLAETPSGKFPTVRVDQGDRPLPGGRSREELERPTVSGGKQEDGRNAVVRPGRPSAEDSGSGSKYGRPGSIVIQDRIEKPTRPTARAPQGSEGMPRPSAGSGVSVDKEPLPRRRVGPDDPDGSRYNVKEIPRPRTQAPDDEGSAKVRPGSGGVTTARPRGYDDDSRPVTRPKSEGYSRPSSGSSSRPSSEGYSRPSSSGYSKPSSDGYSRPSAGSGDSDDRVIRPRPGYERPADRPTPKVYEPSRPSSSSTPDRGSSSYRRPEPQTSKPSYQPSAPSSYKAPERVEKPEPRRESSSSSSSPRSYSRPERAPEKQSSGRPPSRGRGKD